MKAKKQFKGMNGLRYLMAFMCFVVLFICNTVCADAKLIRATKQGSTAPKVKINKSYTVTPNDINDNQEGLLVFKAPKTGKYKFSISNLKIQEDEAALEMFGDDPTEARLEFCVMDKQSAMLTEETDELHFKKWDKLKTKTKKSKYSTSKKALRIANYHYAKYRYKEPQKNYGLITLQGGTVYLLYFELDTISDEYDTYTFDLKITRTK